MRYFILIIPYLISFQLLGQLNPPDSSSNRQIFFLEQTETLNKQLSQFKGKVIYIDIWATWCAPCISSLEYIKELNEYFNQNSIIFLGLCVDMKQHKDNWKNLIYKHAVTGYHVFVEYETIDTYKSDLEISRKEKKLLMEGYPRHLIVDKNGKIVELWTYGPKNKEKLIQQLSSYIN